MFEQYNMSLEKDKRFKNINETQFVNHTDGDG